jgi:hypothetical protein
MGAIPRLAGKLNWDAPRSYPIAAALFASVLSHGTQTLPDFLPSRGSIPLIVGFIFQSE